MTAPRTHIDAFSGIGGFTEGLRRAGVVTTAAIEIDAPARAAYRRHFPGVRIFTDIREVKPDDLLASGFDPARGILTGGFPCTDLSVAGLGAGLGGSRSGLYWELVRLADALRPEFVVLENVTGLLSSVCPCPGDGACLAHGRAIRCGRWVNANDPAKRRWADRVLHSVDGGACAGGCMATHGGAMGAVLGALAELGYGYAYRVLDCRYFGLAQRRPRVFIVGSARDWAAPAEILFEPERRDRGPAEGQAARPAPAPGPGRGPRADGAAPELASTLQGGGRRGYRVDAEGAAGGLLVPQTVAAITTRTGEAIADSDATSPLVVGPLTTKDSVRGAAGGGLPIIAAPITPATARFGDVGDTEPNLVVTARGEAVAYPLTSNGADATEDGTGRGTPLIAFDLRQITSGENRSNPRPGDPAPTMTTDSRQVVTEDLGVRRLTPTECERLQGYPDGWTAGQSDAARYRELGNAVPVPVVAWIAGRLVAVADREEP